MAKHSRVHTVTLYTLAPATMDRAGTESSISAWLYKDSNIPEQALRQVVMPEEKYFAQRNYYTANSTYPTFTEIGLSKAIAKGEVYKHNDNGIAFDPMKAVLEIAQNNKHKEVDDMPRRKIEKMPARTQRVQDMRTPQVPALDDMTPLGLPTASALDAILAQPIAAPLVDIDGAALVNPSGDAPARIRVEGEAESTIAFDSRLYVMFVRAFKQALREEGLVIVPASTMLIPAAPEALAAPMVKDTLGDAWGDFLPVSEPVVPAKRVSTLKVFASQPVEKTVRASSVDDKTIAAIRADYLNKRMTQAALARKYDISSQKVWHIVTGK